MRTKTLLYTSLGLLAVIASALAQTSSDIKGDIDQLRGPDEPKHTARNFEGTCRGFLEDTSVGTLIEPEQELKALRDGEGWVFCKIAPGSANDVRIKNACSSDSVCEVKGKLTAHSDDAEVEIVEARVINSLPSWKGTCYGEIRHENDGYFSVGLIDNLGTPCGFYATSVSKTIFQTCPLGSICGVTGRFEKTPEAPLSNSGDSPMATLGYVDSVKMDRAPSTNDQQQPSAVATPSNEVEQCNDPSVLKTITETNLDKYRNTLFPQDADARRLLASVVSSRDTERMKTLVNEKLNYSVINIRQANYDSQNNIRYCSATYKIGLPAEPDATFAVNYVQSIAMILQVSGVRLADFCQNGPITFKIERVLDKAGFYVSWDCEHRPQ